jgi:hypothetical protein
MCLRGCGRLLAATGTPGSHTRTLIRKPKKSWGLMGPGRSASKVRASGVKSGFVQVEATWRSKWVQEPESPCKRDALTAAPRAQPTARQSVAGKIMPMNFPLQRGAYPLPRECIRGSALANVKSGPRSSKFGAAGKSGHGSWATCSFRPHKPGSGPIYG